MASQDGYIPYPVGATAAQVVAAIQRVTNNLDTELDAVKEYKYVSKTTAYTAIARNFIFCDTTSGIFSITLPSSPTIGDKVVIVDSANSFETNNLTIVRNGNTIMGISENLDLDLNNSTTELIYSGIDWRIL